MTHIRTAIETGNNALKNKYYRPLYLCGFNSANYDLYFFINLLLKSSYAKRFVSKTIFKGSTLVFFALLDRETGKIALKSHDIYQIVLCSLDNACESYLNEKAKGYFPHKMINHTYFNDQDVLFKSFDLTPQDFYKRDQEAIKGQDLTCYNILDNLVKYAKNDTVITLKLYQAVNKLCHEYLETDILTNADTWYDGQLWLHAQSASKVLHKTNNGNQGRNHTYEAVSVRSEGERVRISRSIYGGRAMPRVHHTHHQIMANNTRISRISWDSSIYLACMCIS